MLKNPLSIDKGFFCFVREDLPFHHQATQRKKLPLWKGSPSIVAIIIFLCCGGTVSAHP